MSGEDVVWEALPDKLRNDILELVSSNMVPFLIMTEGTDETLISIVKDRSQIDAFLAELDNIAKAKGKLYVWGIRNEGKEGDQLYVTTMTTIYIQGDEDKKQKIREFIEEALSYKPQFTFNLGGV